MTIQCKALQESLGETVCKKASQYSNNLKTRCCKYSTIIV